MSIERGENTYFQLFHCKYLKEQRLFLYIVDEMNENKSYFESSVRWVFELDRMPKGLEFPSGHSKANWFYFLHPNYDNVYHPWVDHEINFERIKDVTFIPPLKSWIHLKCCFIYLQPHCLVSHGKQI